MARRKRLIGIATLDKAVQLRNMGVPLSTVHKSLGLADEWSYQATADVINSDIDGLHSVTRPSWLQAEPLIQETPADWHFEGTFPYGEWAQEKPAVALPLPTATVIKTLSLDVYQAYYDDGYCNILALLTERSVPRLKSVVTSIRLRLEYIDAVTEEQQDALSNAQLALKNIAEGLD